MSTIDQTSSYDNLYDDDEEYTVTPRNQSRAKRASQVLILLLVIGLAFWGGQFAQEHWGKKAATTTANRAGAAGFAGRTGTGTGTGTAARTGTSARTGATGTATGTAAGGTTAAGAAAGGFGGFGGGTAGTVTLVDGTNIYITETDGNVVKVSTASGTTFDKTVAGTISDVKPGSTVTVRGTTATDGTVAATTINLSSTAAAG